MLSVLLFRSLPALLGLLLASVNPFEPLNPLDIYGTDPAGYFRQHWVREVTVLEQGYYRGQSYPRRPLAVLQLDRQGRVVKEWKHPNEGRFSTLLESTYDKAGQLTSLTTYQNNTPVADTSLLGTQWRPETRAHYPVAPAQDGYNEHWNHATGAWQRTEAVRRWTSHDTTYVRTTNLTGGTCGNLVRTYPTPNGRTRIDYLMTGQCFLNDMVLVEPQYLYERKEKGRMVELGTLRFEAALQDYLRQHPEVPAPTQGTHAYSDLLDYVARHADGQADAPLRNTYDAQGRLLRETSRYQYTSYQRNAQGRLQGTELYAQRLPTDTPAREHYSTFSYQPNGLVAKEERSEQINGLAGIRYYRYRYY
jgi:YD repeat-containing protein